MGDFLDIVESEPDVIALFVLINYKSLALREAESWLRTECILVLEKSFIQGPEEVCLASGAQLSSCKC